MPRLIDADNLFKCETCRHHRSGDCDTWCEIGESYRPDMSKFPTIDPEELRPKGRWEKQGNGRTCNQCKFVYYSNNDDFNYCPNCGADMRGDNRDTT